MTSLAVAPTGAAFGEFDEPASWKMTHAGTGDWTGTRLRNVEISSVRDAVNTFDAALSATNSLLLFIAPQISRTVEIVLDRGDVSLDWLFETAVVGTEAVGSSAIGSITREYHFEPLELVGVDPQPLGQQPAVIVVKALVDGLGLPKRDVLRAAGISRSTFHTWDKPEGPRPRVASQGQLWALAEAVEDLTEHLGALELVGPWLLADNRRKALLREGDFDALLNLAAPAAVTDSATYLAGLYGAGQEKLEPRYSNAAAARRSGPSTVTSTAVRTKRGTY